MQSITRKLFICLLLVLTAGICQYGSQDIEKSSSKSFRFAWPIPSKVVVNETTLKKGKTAKMRYTLDIAKVKGGAVISFKDYEFLEFQGIDVTSPEMKRKLGPALKIAKYIPSFRIQTDGQLVEIQGMEEMLDQIFKLATNLNHLDAKLDPGIIQTLKSPQYKKYMDMMIATYWYIWVGLWREVNISPGETLEIEVEPSLLGIPLDQSAKAKIMHLGPAPEHPGKVKLEYQNQYELTKESIHKMTQEIMKIAKESGKEFGDQHKKALDFKNFKMGSFIEIIMDPNTLMPDYVKYERNATATSKDGKSGSQVEKHEYTFNWHQKKKNGAVKDTLKETEDIFLKIGDEKLSGRGVLGAPRVNVSNIKEISIASIQPPKLIKSTQPKYPPEALKAHIQGRVVINVVADTKGRVVEAKVINGHPLLRSAALEAVKKWQYEPYIMNGVPRPVKFTVVVKFNVPIKKKNQ